MFGFIGLSLILYALLSSSPWLVLIGIVLIAWENVHA